jgi:DNA-binding response OmpR family regulator
VRKRKESTASSACVLNLECCQAVVGRKEISLTLTECSLLACLLEQPGVTLTREELIRRVWGGTFRGNPTTVNAHIQRLRKKLGRAAKAIQSVRGQGYRWKPPLVKKTHA